MASIEKTFDRTKLRHKSFLSALFALWPGMAHAQTADINHFAEPLLLSCFMLLIGICIGLYFYRKEHRKNDGPLRAQIYLAHLKSISHGFSLFLKKSNQQSEELAIEWLIGKAKKTLEVDVIRYWSFNEDQQKAVCLYQSEPKEHNASDIKHLEIAKHPRFFSAIKKDATFGVHFTQSDLRTIDLANALPENPRPRSTLLANCGMGKKVYGFLEISMTQDQRNWGEIDLHFSGSIADLIAVYLSTQNLQNTQTALKASESKLQDLLDASSDWYWETDVNHCFSFFSEQFTDITGISKYSVLGKSRHDIVDANAQNSKWADHWDDLHNHRPFKNFQYSTFIDGRTITVTINGKPFFDHNGTFLGYRGTGSDISDSTTFKTRFEEAVNALPNGFLMWDQHDRLINWNRKALDFFPFAAPHVNKALTFRELFELCIKHDILKLESPADDNLITKYVAGHKACGTHEIELKDGTFLLLQEHPTSEGGIVGIYTDITKLKARENELYERKKISDALTACSNVLFHARNQSYILSEICRIITSVAPFDGVWISLIKQEGKLSETIQINLAENFKPPLDHHRVSPALKKAFTQQREILVSEDSFDENFNSLSETLYQSQIKQVAIFPILTDGMVSGFINVTSKQSEKFKPRYISLMRELVNDVGYGLTALKSEQIRLQTEEALRESEGRYRSLVDMSPDAILVLDNANRIIFCNSEGHRLFGTRHRADILNLPFSQFVEDQRNIFADLNQNGNDQKTHFISAVRIRRFDDSLIDLDITTRPVAYGGLTTHLLILRDVTEKNRVSEQIAQASKMATLGEMAAGITHELSQPLNIMRFAAEGSLLKMGKGTIETEEIQKQFNLISMQSARMADIIDHMRVFSRQDPGSIEFFDPTVVVRQSVDMVEAQFLAEGIHMDIRYPPHYGQLKGRPIQLEQVLLNLINNARDAINQYFKSDAVDNNTLKQINIIMTYDQADNKIKIAVVDNGGGISTDKISKLFDPFFTTKEVGKGTGLGLSVSYGIISAMGGEISARNIHKGARFEIIIPCIESSPTLPEIKRPSTQLDPDIIDDDEIELDFDGDGPKVLVVDDEIYAAEAMMEHLFLSGYQVNMAGDGEEALEIFKEEPADIVVTDIRMPRMDGARLLHALKEINPTIPVIIVTGHAGSEDNETNELAQKAFSILKKPVSLADLTKAVEAAVTNLRKSE